MKIWDAETRRETARTEPVGRNLVCLAFSPDGKTLATASHDRKVKLWNVATHQELVTFSFAAHLISARFSPDGRSLAVGYFNERGMHIELIRAPGFEQIAAAESSQTTDSPR